MLLNHNKNPPHNYSFQNEVIGTYFSHLNFILNKKILCLLKFNPNVKPNATGLIVASLSVTYSLLFYP
jgi:hypothetical protein